MLKILISIAKIQEISVGSKGWSEKILEIGEKTVRLTENV